MQTVPAMVDVAIVGGGFAGLATAWWLQRRGVRDVVVLEREPTLGAHASGRNAGLGRQLVDDDATTALTVAGLAWLRAGNPRVDSGGRAPFRTTGSILTFDDATRAHEYRDRAAHFGVAIAELAPREARRRWPALGDVPVVAALAIADDGVIDPVALLAAYAAPIERVVTGVAVHGVSAATTGDGTAAVLATDRGSVRARVVVNAAGAWAGRVGDSIGATATTLTSKKRHVFVARFPTSGDLAALGASAPFLWHLGSDEGYLRAHSDGILGSHCDARVADADDQSVDDFVDAQRRAHFARWSKALVDAPVPSTWACLRTFTTSGIPRIEFDRDLPWLCWVAGLGGHGASASSVVGQRAAELIAARLA